MYAFPTFVITGFVNITVSPFSLNPKIKKIFVDLFRKWRQKPNKEVQLIFLKEIISLLSEQNFTDVKNTALYTQMTKTLEKLPSKSVDETNDALLSQVQIKIDSVKYKPFLYFKKNIFNFKNLFKIQFPRFTFQKKQQIIKQQIDKGKEQVKQLVKQNVKFSIDSSITHSEKALEDAKEATKQLLMLDKLDNVK